VATQIDVFKSKLWEWLQDRGYYDDVRIRSGDTGREINEGVSESADWVAIFDGTDLQLAMNGYHGPMAFRETFDGLLDFFMWRGYHMELVEEYLIEFYPEEKIDRILGRTG
jgi:hypothetical protein